MRGGLQNDRLLVAALLECAQQKAQLLCNHQSDGDGVVRSGFSWKFRAWCSAWPRSVLGNACTDRLGFFSNSVTRKDGRESDGVTGYEIRKPLRSAVDGWRERSESVLL